MEVDDEAPPPNAWHWAVVELENSVELHLRGWATVLGCTTACLAKCLLGEDRLSEMALVSLVGKALKPGAWPNVSPKGGMLLFTREEGELLDDPAGAYRQVGSDVVVFGSPLAFWPPQLGDRSRGAAAWSLHKAGWTEAEVRAWLGKVSTGTRARALFREFTKEGAPTNHFVLRVEGTTEEEWVQFEEGGVECQPLGLCSFCQKNRPFAGKHAMSQCPIRGMVNKLRSAQGLREVRCGEESFDFDMGMVDFDAKAQVAKLEKRVEELEKAMKALEATKPTAGPKWKAGKPDEPPNNNKRPKKDAPAEKPAGKGKRDKGKGKA
ncbi:hypothetical protein FRC10_005555 [Ceratobasidium sp. 414]|nr:hypothetical protein FRC10_005555 [Ceratobasidium sp. 414]